MKNNIAIIPARGGSKGIPIKNLRKLAGKPLIGYTIENAIKSDLIDRVFVSTDDDKIGKISLKFGAEVIKRPSEISGDNASSESALLHAIEHIKREEGSLPEIITFLQCTSPLTLPEDIDGTISTLLTNNADVAFTVTPNHSFLWEEKDGSITPINHDSKHRLMRQQRENQYLENGAVYVMRTKGFLEAKHRFFGHTVMHIMPAERCFEIDEEIDIKIVEILIAERNAKNILDILPSDIKGLVLDFDGVFTDNKVIVFQDGTEAVMCDRSDGLAISKLKDEGIRILVLSAEKNPIVSRRCEKLGVACIHGLNDKLSVLRKWITKNHYDQSNILYVGNDTNDIECMEYAGVGISVADAYPLVKKSAQLILSSSGGKGAIRELCDLILEKRRNS